MKKRRLIYVVFVLVMCLVFAFAACKEGNAPDGDVNGGNNSGSGNNNGSSGNSSNNGDNGNSGSAPENAGKVLVAFFSATNTTKGVAEKIADSVKGTLHEIKPVVPYTSADLNYNDRSSRSTKEQNDSSARPQINGSVENISQYGVIFLGYPIWHGQAPKILYTFLESYDFSDKTIVPFCTSASSGIGSSDTNLHPLAPNADWKEGRRFSSGATQSAVDDWITSLDVLGSQQQERITKMFVYVNDNRLEVTLADNSSAAALTEILEQGDITYTADDYGNFEKVGDIGHTLPQNNEQITTEAGDVILYQGRSICLYYDTNSWNFTRIGKISGYTASEMRTLLGAGSGSVQVRISLK